MFQLKLIFLAISVYFMLSANAWAVDVQTLMQSHQAAVAEYQKKNKDFYKSIDILRKAGIQKIIKEKPEDMPEESYISLLNDYGFFLLLTKKCNLYVEVNYCEAKKVLEKVNSLAPEKFSVYLNLGDLYWNMFLAEKYINSHNAASIRRKFRSGECYGEVKVRYPSYYPYHARQMYLKYASLMTYIGKANDIPKRIRFILNNNRMFVVVRDDQAMEDEHTRLCHDYVASLNKLLEKGRTYCNRDIFSPDTPFQKVGSNEISESLKKRFFTPSWSGITFKYKDKLYFDTGATLWGKPRRYYVPQCEYRYLDITSDESINPACPVKGEQP